MTREELLADLLLERFGSVAELERERGPVQLNSRRRHHRRVPVIYEIEERTA